MKTKIERKPDGAFVDTKRPPTETELKFALGATFPALDEVLAALRAAQPAITSEWKYSPRVGWYQIWLIAQRRLFYLVPQRDNFRLSLIVGQKALEALLAGPRGVAVKRRLKTAKRYPEGTAFAFTAGRFDAGLVLAFVAAKIAH